MEVTSLGFRSQLALLGLSGSQVEDRGDHIVVRSPDNPDHWWGNFVLLGHVPAPQHCEEWVERFHQLFPGSSHVAIGFDGDGRREDMSWFALRGYDVCADEVLTARNVTAARATDPAAELRIITSDADWDQVAAMRLRVWHRHGEGDSARVYVKRRVAGDRRMSGSGPGAWFGAFVGGRLVSQLGLVACGGGRARFQVVATEPEFERRGLAAGLIHLAGSWGRAELGVEELVIVADPDYHAIDLYRRAGFRTAGRQLTAELAPGGPERPG